MAYLGLYALQHRGQESAGIAASDGERLVRLPCHGPRRRRLHGGGTRAARGAACGRPRSLLHGGRQQAGQRPADADRVRARPDRAVPQRQPGERRRACGKTWCATAPIFQTSSDTEVILHLYARSKAALPEDALVESLAQIQGAFSLVVATPDRLIAVRDPHGFRPLALGRLGDAMVVAPRRARWISSAPRACATWSRARCSSSAPPARGRSSRSRPPHRRTASSSTSTSPARTATSSARASTRCGPGSGACSRANRRSRRMSSSRSRTQVSVRRSGYAEETGIPLRMGLIRNHYVGRTFIEPQQSIRHFGVKVKLNPVRSILDGQRVVLVDDSIVRGTTSRKIVRMIKAAGAKEVHVRISCPPTISPCFYGVDTPRRSELIAATHTLEEIRKYLGADSLALPQPGGPPRRGQLAPVRLLHRLLHRQLPGPVPARTPRATCNSR